jgi:hypothetical protein
MSYSSDSSPSISRSASRSSAPSSISEFQPAKIFLLSPTLLDVHFLTNFANKLDKGLGDKIVIPIYHTAISPSGWLQEAIGTLPSVDLDGKQWDKCFVEGIVQGQPLVGEILTLS